MTPAQGQALAGRVRRALGALRRGRLDGERFDLILARVNARMAQLKRDS